MSVEKDESNTSDPTPAVPHAVAETTKARTNEGDPLVTPGTSEAAAPLEQAGPVPKSPPVEPVSKSPPPSPPHPSIPTRAQRLLPMPASDRVIVQLDFCGSKLASRTYSLKVEEQMVRVLSGLAQEFGVSRYACESRLRLMRYGARAEWCVAGESVDADELGTKERPIMLDVFAEHVGGPVKQVGGPVPPDAIMAILTPV